MNSNVLTNSQLDRGLCGISVLGPGSNQCDHFHKKRLQHDSNPGKAGFKTLVARLR